MKIKRIINEKEIEIELTGSELREAFYEQDRNFYIEDVKFRYDCSNLDNSAIANIAEDWKYALGNNDVYWDSYWATLRCVAKENGLEEIEEY